MKTFVLFLLLCFGSCLVLGQSESPYFLVNGGTEPFPLRATAAEVNIAGVIADVTVRQTYVNDGTRPIEATYVFPASTEAAVYGMRMRIGHRVIEGEVMRRAEARQTYETARAEGKRASLLEQHRPNVFQMNVANILPGDTVEVELRYTELIVPESGVYAFVYPTVVGPRYAGGGDAVGPVAVQPVAVRPLAVGRGTARAPTFNLRIYLNAGMPLATVGSPTHRLRTTQLAASSAVNLELAGADRNGGDRDFVLEYQLGGEEIQTGMLLFEGEEENYFLYMAQPPLPDAPTDAHVPAEYVFLIDVSGSMTGFPLDVSKRLLTDLVARLQPTDRFNLLLFAGANLTWQPASVPATPENLAEALAFLQLPEGGGGTELLPALETAYALPHDTTGLSRNFVVVTDGYILVEPEVFDLIDRRLGEANVYSFGIGSSVNRHLIEGMARIGRGRPAVVLDPSEAAGEADRFRRYISSPVLTDLTLTHPGFEAYDLEPNQLPDLTRERPLILFGKYRGRARGKLQLRGTGGDTGGDAGTKLLDYPVRRGDADPRHAALRYLWARHRIQYLDDYNNLRYDSARVEEVTRLGLEHNLLTQYTSFVAVDKTPVLASGEGTPTVDQPLPLPAGLSASAVGFDLAFAGVSGVPAATVSLPWWSYLTLGLVGLFAVVVWRKMRGLLATVLAMGLLTGCEVTGGNADARSSEGIVRQQIVRSPAIEARRSLTFILGEDAGSNAYYGRAERYYRAGGHTVVTGLHDLTAVHEYLAQAPAGRGYDTIRLVVHGNPWTGLAAGLHPGEQRLGSQSLTSASVTPLPGIDERTRVIVQGCGVGGDRELLLGLSRYFAGHGYPTVAAARQFSVFREDERGGVVLQYADYYYRARPLGDYPLPSVMAVRFGRQHPEVDVDWSAALASSRFAEETDPYLYQFNVPVSWTQLHPGGGTVYLPERPAERTAWLAGQPELTGQLNRMGLTPDNFRWTFARTRHQLADGTRLPAVRAEGTARLFCVLVPVGRADTVSVRYFREV